MAMIRRTVHYQGSSRSSLIEEELNKLFKKHNVRRGGEWSFLDRGFGVLIIFEKTQDADRFALALRDLGRKYNQNITFGGY